MHVQFGVCRARISSLVVGGDGSCLAKCQSNFDIAVDGQSQFFFISVNAIAYHWEMQAFISHLIPALCVYAAYSYDFSGYISYYLTYCIMHIVMLKVYVVNCKRFILGLTVV